MTGTIVIAGGTGTLGSACTDYLRSKGFRVCVLSRRKFPNDPDSIQWDPEREWIAENVVDGAHAVIHLTGRALPDQRWTSAYKQILHDSRIVPAQFLGKLIGQCSRPPEIYLGMSAAGIYGDAGTSPVAESAVPEDSDRFVIRLVQAWEEAHRKAGDGLRTVILRCPPVLNMKDGFLPRMLGPARIGLYAYFGNGRQILSWVMLNDLCRAMYHAIETEGLNGVYNVAAEEAVSFRTFVTRLRSARGSFGAVVPVPKVLIRIAFGQMAQILFDSIHVDSGKIRNTGFQFAFDKLDVALRHLLRS